MMEFNRNTSAIAAPYPLHVRWSDEDSAHLGSIPGLIGDCCHADSPEQVLVQRQDIAEDLLNHLMPFDQNNRK
jgi:hypothetical protein